MRSLHSHPEASRSLPIQDPLSKTCASALFKISIVGGTTEAQGAWAGLGMAVLLLGFDSYFRGPAVDAGSFRGESG